MDKDALAMMNAVDQLHTWLCAQLTANRNLLSDDLHSEFANQLWSINDELLGISNQLDFAHRWCECHPLGSSFTANRITLPKEEGVFASCDFCGATFSWCNVKGVIEVERR